MDDESDTHICLRCHTTIIGLDDYVKHKKTECPSLNVNANVKPKSPPPPPPPPPTNTNPSPSNEPLSEVCGEITLASSDLQLRQESFFTLLELQSKNSPQKTIQQPPTTTTTSSELVEFNKIELDRPNDETQPYEYILEQLSEESEDGLNHPPQTHTGGKWKPGSGPTAEPVEEDFSTEDQSRGGLVENGQDHDYFESQDVSGKMDVASNSTSSSLLYCAVCDLKLASKRAYDRHFNGHKHLRKVGEIDSADMEYNCEVCDRNLSSKFAYLRHVSSPCHRNKMKQIESNSNSDGEFVKVRKSLRRMCKNKLLSDKMWKLEGEDDKDDLEITKSDDDDDVDDEEEDENDVVEPMTLVSTTPPPTPPSVSLVCVPCKRTFQSKRNFAQHLLTAFHMKRTENNPERLELIFKHLDLLTKLAPFQCGICSYYFNHLDYFIQHWNSRVHSDNVAAMLGPFLCVECECVCESNEEMLSHLMGEEHMELVETLDRKHPIIIKEKRSDLTCKECDCKFASAFALKKHEESAAHQRMCSKNNNTTTSTTNKKKFECQICGWNASTRSSLETHVKKHDEKSLPPENETNIDTDLEEPMCPTGETMTTTATTSPTNTNEEVFTCSTCNYVCLSSTRLAFHQALHQQPEMMSVSGRSKPPESLSDPPSETEPKPSGQLRTVKKYKCSYCDKMFPKASLLSHLHTHTGEKPYKCDICNMAFAQRGTLYMHLRRHTGVKKYKCDLCPFAAEKPSRLRRHQEIHNANRPRSHLCDICGTGYHDRWALRHHMKVHYGKDHKCPFEGCNQAFRCPSELQLHVRVHTDERPFLCDKCGYRGRSQHQLTKHRRSHTGERPFKCAYCSYSAHLSPHLLRHMRIHTGAKPYKCPYCDYTCNTQENVRKHILKTKKHEGKKMYPCRFCDYTTNLAADYKTHVLDNHKSMVSSEETDVISLLAGVYNRTDNIKVTSNPIPYIPRMERVKTEKKKKNGRVVKNRPQDETMVYTVQIPGSTTFDVMEAAAAEQILQCIETNQGEAVYLPVEQQIGEEVLISCSGDGEDREMDDGVITQGNLIPSDTSQKTYLIYVPIE